MSAKMCALYDEHVLLGATFETVGADPGLVVAASYPGEPGAGSASCTLTDVSGMLMRRISGASARALVEMGCAGRRLETGESAFEAMLAGDGAVMSVPLVARTGEREYALWDLSSRGELVGGWLDFLSKIEQNGTKPFPDVSLEAVDDRLVPLALWGPAASRVLGDYLSEEETLPAKGQVRNLFLDQTDCLMACPPELSGCYLVLVPRQKARAFWRSFLSFQEVAPLGRQALLERLGRRLPWFGRLSSGARIAGSRHELLRERLIRSDDAFVGARGLA